MIGGSTVDTGGGEVNSVGVGDNTAGNVGSVIGSKEVEEGGRIVVIGVVVTGAASVGAGSTPDCELN